MCVYIWVCKGAHHLISQQCFANVPHLSYWIYKLEKGHLLFSPYAQAMSKRNTYKQGGRNVT